MGDELPVTAPWFGTVSSDGLIRPNCRIGLWLETTRPIGTG